MTLNLGDQIPVVQTVFGAAAAGGFANIPQSSFTYRTSAINMVMTPRVTYEGEIILDLTVESSNLGPSVSVAGQDVPSFGSRRVTTRLRLREGESNLLAGLLRDEQREDSDGAARPDARARAAIALRSDERTRSSQTDIVMLLTPHIVRTHELTVNDLAPIYMGTQQNVGLGGPPPLIQAAVRCDECRRHRGADADAAGAPITTPTPQFLPPPPGDADAGDRRAGRRRPTTPPSDCRRLPRATAAGSTADRRRRLPPTDAAAARSDGAAPPAPAGTPAGRRAPAQIIVTRAAGVPLGGRPVHRAALGRQRVARCRP